MKELIRRYEEFILYALFGVGTVTVDMGLYCLLVDRVGIPWANAWGWLGAVLFAFLTNKYFVFHTGHRGATEAVREFWEVVAVRLVSLLLEVQGVAFLVSRGADYPVFGITGGVAKILVTILVIVINYVCSKFFIFRTERAGV